jgi:hypothetical protein
MKRISASILLFIIACFLTFDAVKFPDIHTDYTNACFANAEFAQFTASQTKLLIQCPEGPIKIKCNVNTELCSMVGSAKPTLSHLKLVRTSFLEDYFLLSAVVDGKEVSFVSTVEQAVARAYQALWIYVALTWLAFLLSLFLLQKGKIGRFL